MGRQWKRWIYIGEYSKGWIVCDGKSRDASDFQMLASMIGETYGGDLSGEFPNIEGQFFTLISHLES